VVLDFRFWVVVKGKEAVMNCKEMGDRLLDLASGTVADAETGQHLQTCNACAEKLASLAQTMDLLEEWQAPEPSPYFDTRLYARLREESSKEPQRWLGWFRRPALAVSMAAIMALGIALVGLGGGNQAQHPEKVVVVDARPGSAIADLQSLDKNHDLLANFDLLDDDDSDSGSTAVNP
jgi:anti-sigma factor RsiW